jgi:molybdopterin-containing oxidoreductase family iron-sulfur binding subunit
MIYNRCVGTRYCSNNCTYKVRRFNWFTFPLEGDMKWAMNPQVSVRQKGVMEKCNFCQHRIRDAKSLARDIEEDGKVKDGKLTTACQDACPSQAITFGNIMDEHSAIHTAAHDERAYRALDSHLATKPGVSYLKRVELTSGEEKHG